MSQKSNPEHRSELVKLRQRLGLTQEDVAEALNVTVRTVANWEHGRAIPKLTIPQTKTLCRLLQCNIEDLPDDFGPR